MIENLAQYRILERVGVRDLGDAYRARDSRLGRTVMLEVLPDSIAGDPDRLARFRRAVTAAAALSHPNIAAVYEIGDDQGRLFLVSEFAPGETLQAAIGGHPMNPRRAVDLTVQMADALAEGHAQGIVHGDLTSAAVIVTPKGRAKILKFGLRAGAVDRGASDEYADILALGAVLREMLTGTLTSSVRASLPPEVEGIVAKAIDRDGGPGYQSAAAFASDLRGVSSLLEARRAAAERGTRGAGL